jgi:hypothetical protein
MLSDLEKPIERIDETVLKIDDKLKGLYNFAEYLNLRKIAD